MKTFLCSLRFGQYVVKPLLCATLVLATGCIGEASEESIVNENTDQESDALSGTAPSALFQGVDTVTGAGLNTAMQLTQGGKISSAPKKTWSITRVYSTDTLAEELGINGSLQAEFGLVGSVAGKGEFAKSVTRSKYSVGLVVHAWRTKSLAISDAVLKPSVALALKNKQLTAGQFVRQYGDVYVSGAEQGAELLGVYMFHSDTQETQDKIVAELKADATIEGVKVSGQLGVKLSKIAAKTQSSYSFYGYVAGSDSTPYFDETNVLDAAKNFINKPIEANGIVTSFTVTPYSIAQLDSIATNREYMTDSSPTGPGALLLDMTKLHAQIEDLEDIYAFYNNTQDDAVLLNHKTVVEQDMKTLTDQMGRYKRDPGATDPGLNHLKQYKRSDFKSLTSTSAFSGGFPVLNVTAHSWTPKGSGSGGDSFNDLPIGAKGYVLRKTRLAGFQMAAYKGNGELSNLSVKYVDRNHSGGIHATGNPDPNAVWFSHGGNSSGGCCNKSAVTKLDDGVFLNWVGVWNGLNAGAKSVTFLNLCAEASCSHYGSKVGTYDGFTPPAHSVVMGFSGTAGAQLDSIKVEYVTFGKTLWKP